MMKSIKPILAILLFGILYASCEKNKGNGQITSEARQLASFTKVEVAGAYTVYVNHDSKSEVKIEAESNLIQYIRTEVNNGILTIDNSQNIQPEFDIKIYVKTPDVNTLELSGSGVIEADSLVGDNAEVDISGSGIIETFIIANHVEVKNSGSGLIKLEFADSTETLNYSASGSGLADFTGSTNNGNFDISGSGNINALNLVLNELNATISGSGNMNVNVIDYLNVNISGSGSVFYIGNPALDINITSSGSVNKL
jgi:hypothetical protein